MIRVRKGDAEQDGGCNECHARGPVLCLDIGRDQLRLCSGCCSTLLAEVVRVDVAAATGKLTRKVRRPKKADRDAALAVACPLCKAGPGEVCRGEDGLHYSRMAQARAGQPTLAPSNDRPALTRVRDMAPRAIPASPHMSAQKRSKNGSGRPAARKVPKPYKARRS